MSKTIAVPPFVGNQYGRSTADRRVNRRKRSFLPDYIALTVLGCTLVMFFGMVGVMVNNHFFPTKQMVAERAMLDNTTFRKFAVMCPTPAMSAEQLVLWHQYAARKGYPAMPEAGPNCYDP